MIKNFGEVFKRLPHAGLKLKAKKCNLFAKKKNNPKQCVPWAYYFTTECD